MYFFQNSLFIHFSIINIFQIPFSLYSILLLICLASHSFVKKKRDLQEKTFLNPWNTKFQLPQNSHYSKSSKKSRKASKKVLPPAHFSVISTIVIVDYRKDKTLKWTKTPFNSLTCFSGSLPILYSFSKSIIFPFYFAAHLLHTTSLLFFAPSQFFPKNGFNQRLSTAWKNQSNSPTKSRPQRTRHTTHFVWYSNFKGS